MSDRQLHKKTNERLAAAIDLLRLNTETMTNAELDYGVALLLGQHCRRAGDVVEIAQEGKWVPFSITSDWNDYGHVITNVGVVTGSHELFEDESDCEKVTGHWYSCHAFYGSTNVDGRDVRLTVAQTCTQLLRHHADLAVEYNGPFSDFTGDLPTSLPRP